jgi:hypothetical protein
VAPALLLVMLAGARACADRDTAPAAATPAPAAPTPAARSAEPPPTRPSGPRRRPAPIRWRASRAVGSPSAGRLERGVQLPAERGRFLTWDPVRRRSPEDERERAPKDATEIDRRLSQALVDLFVAHGAQVIFVGPGTGLAGPPGRVQTLANHDNHLHVRLP